MSPTQGLPRLEGDGLVLRDVEESDLDALVAIRSDPTVARWWDAIDEAEFRGDLRGDVEHEYHYLIEVDGETAGMVQFYEEPGIAFRSAAIDIFLGAGWQGRQLGRRAIELLTDYLIDQRGHRRLTIDPAEINAAAVRCYAAAGFRTVGIMREYQQMEDGTRLDGVLMELVASDRRGAAAP